MFLHYDRDKGMKYLMGNDWRDIFDVIIVQARKPKFFTDDSRPFRIFDPDQGTHLWDKVHRLEKGRVYYEVRYTLIQLPIKVAVYSICQLSPKFINFFFFKLIFNCW